MFQSGTQTLIDRLAALPRTAGLPARADFQPLEMGPLVPHLFSAARSDPGAVLRLAGEWVEALHGRPLKGAQWLDLWAPESRALVAQAVTQTVREARPVVILGETPQRRGVIEITLAALRGSDGAPDRLIGLYQSTEPLDRRREAVGPLTARLSVGVGAPSRPRLTLAALEGRRIA